MLYFSKKLFLIDWNNIISNGGGQVANLDFMCSEIFVTTQHREMNHTVTLTSLDAATTTSQ